MLNPEYEAPFRKQPRHRQVNANSGLHLINDNAIKNAPGAAHPRSVNDFLTKALDNFPLDMK